MNIVGLDLSLNGTGICCGDCGQTRTLKPPKDQREGMDRLHWIRWNVLDHTTRWEFIGDPAPLVIIESYTYATTHSAHVLGELGGIIRYTLWHARVPYIDVPPATLKKFATGKGNANKNAMAAAAYKTGYDGPEDDNCIDAWWLRQMGLYERLGAWAGTPPVIPVTAYRDEVVGKITWPEAVGA